MSCVSCCFCKPFVAIYRCCKSDKVKKAADKKVSSVASPTLDPAEPYRRKPEDHSGHIKNRSWQVVNGKMSYAVQDEEGKKKQLKSYKSPKVVRED